MRNPYKFKLGNLKGRDNLRDLDIDGRIKAPIETDL
jgi:hypothetical protein